MLYVTYRINVAVVVGGTGGKGYSSSDRYERDGGGGGLANGGCPRWLSEGGGGDA